MNDQRGIALPLVLWTLLLLSLVAASLAGDSREALRTARNAAAAARAEALADGGISLAVQALLDPRPERRWRADARPYDLAVAGGRLRVRVQDAAGLVDLNTGAEDLLSGLLFQAGLDTPSAQALTASIAARRAQGGRPFDDVSELRLIPGIPPTLSRRLEPLLTVHSGQRGVDPLTAPREVLLALPGLQSPAVDALMATREDSQAIGEIGGGLAVASPGRVFSIMTEAEVDGAIYRRLSILRLTRASDRPFAIHVWRTWYPL